MLASLRVTGIECRQRPFCVLVVYWTQHAKSPLIVPMIGRGTRPSVRVRTLAEGGHVVCGRFGLELFKSSSLIGRGNYPPSKASVNSTARAPSSTVRAVKPSTASSAASGDAGERTCATAARTILTTDPTRP